MKTLTMATALTFTVLIVPLWGPSATAQDAHESHHPGSGAATQPVPPSSSPAAAPGTDGQRGMMGGEKGMMGGMPMMEMMARHHATMCGMPTASVIGLMGPGMAGMASVDHIEGRIAFLRAELRISDAQASVWNAFADALRVNAQKAGAPGATMMPHAHAGQPPAPTIAERLDQQEHWLAERLEATRAIKSAFTKLYEALSDDQKKTANELLAPHAGMGGMAGMPSGQQ